MASFSQKPGGRQTVMDPSEIPHRIFCLMNSPRNHSLKCDERKAGTRCFRKFQTKPGLKMAFPANSVSQPSFYIFLLPMVFSIHGAAGILLLKLFHLRFPFFFLVLNPSPRDHPVYGIPSQNIWESWGFIHEIFGANVSVSFHLCQFPFPTFSPQECLKNSF